MFAFYRDTAQSCFHPTIFLIFFQKDEKKFKFYSLECFRILILRKISLNSVCPQSTIYCVTLARKLLIYEQ
jgi:hypothetical protein